MSKSIPQDLIVGPQPDSVEIKRVPVRVQSDNASYGAGQNVQITLPPDFCDFRNSYLTFYAQSTANGGTYIRFPYPISCIFNRMRIYLGSQLIEDIQDANVLRGMFVLASEYNGITQVNQEGSTTAATRASDTAGGRTYVVHSRFESLMRVWPLHKIRLPFRIMLTIESNLAAIMEYDGSAPTAGIAFNNCFFNYHSLQVPDAVDAMLDAAISAGQAVIRFHSWENYNASLSSAASSSLMLPYKKKWQNACMALYRPTADVTDATKADKFNNDFTGSQVLTQAYLKVGTQIYPADKYDFSLNGTGTAWGYVITQIPFNSILNDHYHAFDRQQDTYMAQAPVTRVCVPFDLRRDNTPGVQLWQNGINTEDSANSSTLGLTFTSAPGALTVDVFAKYEVVVKILPGGSVTIDY